MRRSPNDLPILLDVFIGAIVWTNMPAALTELNGTTNGRVLLDLSKAQEFRLVGSTQVAGFAGSTLLAQADIGAGFVALGNPNPTMVLDGALGVKSTAFTPIVQALRVAGVTLRIAGQDGDGIVDPNFNVRLQLR